MKKAAALFLSLTIVLACSAGASAEKKGNYWVSVPLSVVFPTGDLEQISETGWGAGFGLGYWITDALLIKAQFSYHNFGEKIPVPGGSGKINGAVFPIEAGIAYYFMKESKFRPYVALRAGSYSLQKDFRGELGQKTKPGSSAAVGIAYAYGNVAGESVSGMVFIEPNFCAIYGDETYKYWTVNVGLTWNIGG